MSMSPVHIGTKVYSALLASNISSYNTLINLFPTFHMFNLHRNSDLDTTFKGTFRTVTSFNIWRSFVIPTEVYADVLHLDKTLDTLFYIQDTYSTEASAHHKTSTAVLYSIKYNVIG